MPDIPSTEPTELTQNTTVQWTKYFSDFSPTDWTLSYSFRAANFYLDKTATADGSNFAISLSPSETLSFPQGRVWYSASVTNGVDTYPVSADVIQVRPDLSSLVTYDGRTFAEVMVDAIEAILSGRATAKTLDIVAKGIGSDNIAKRPELLIEWRDKFKREAAEAQGLFNPILVRFE